jgi:hypothetical protein
VHRAPVLAALLLVAVAATSVYGHGSLVNPRPRNSIDRSPVGPDRCECANSTAGACDTGQACYWYQQGCSIGCPTCDSVSGRVQIDICGLGKQATITEPELRTVNVNGTGIYDIYKHNPWRAPGSAPVIDACGLAGGTPWSQNVSEWGEYVTTAYAHHGSRGSELPRLPTGTVWKIGGEADVTWQIRANHGGGYQYRLCPADQPLTEDCFQAHPLDFKEGSQRLQWNDGRQQPIKGVYVSGNKTTPANSMWARLPIPARCLGGSCSSKQPYCQPCPLPVAGRDCTSCANTPDPQFPPPCDEGSKPGLCSGNQPSQWGAVGVVDTIKIPASLAAGQYVLGWRYDCEATAQVWTNCADITLV